MIEKTLSGPRSKALERRSLSGVTVLLGHDAPEFGTRLKLFRHERKRKTQCNRHIQAIEAADYA